MNLVTPTQYAKSLGKTKQWIYWRIKKHPESLKLHFVVGKPYIIIE